MEGSVETLKAQKEVVEASPEKLKQNGVKEDVATNGKTETLKRKSIDAGDADIIECKKPKDDEKVDLDQKKEDGDKKETEENGKEVVDGEEEEEKSTEKEESTEKDDKVEKEEEKEEKKEEETPKE